MRTLRYAALPGLKPRARPYEFQLFEAELRLEIPADHRGPDVAIADDPEQAAWLDRWPGGLRATWDCQWTFADVAALARFLADLGPPLEDPPAVVPAPSASPSPRAAPVGSRQTVLDGGARGNRVEVAEVGQLVVSVGLCHGWPRPWDVTARRGPTPNTFDELVAYWSKDFPVASPATKDTQAHALAVELGLHPALWVVHRVGGPGGAETCRLLDLGQRVVVERLGAKRKLEVHATRAQALARLGPRDVACGLAIPTAAERAAIDALGPPKPPRARKVRPLAPDASLAVRLAEAFRRLDDAGVLAQAKVAGPPSHAWSLVGTARRNEHLGVLFYLADHWRERIARRVLHLYWASWQPGGDALTFAGRLVDVLTAVGVDVVAPASETQSIAVPIVAPRR